MNLADQQNIHPFFSKPNRQPSPERAHEPESAQTDVPPQDENSTNTEEPPVKLQNKGRPLASRARNGKRKTDDEDAIPKVKQASIAAFAGLKKEPNSANDLSEATSLEEDPNIGRRKRQKTATPEPEDLEQSAAEKGGETVDQGEEKVEQEQQPSWLEQLENDAVKETEKEPERIEVEASSPTAHEQEPAPIGSEVVPGTSPRPAGTADEEIRTPVPPSSPPVIQKSPAEKIVTVPSSPSKPSPPRKMLRLNAKGRFSSPVSNPPNDDLVDPGIERKTRSRGRKKNLKQLLVKISYIKDDERAVQMAEDIDEILAGVKRAPELITNPHSKATEPPKARKPTGPPKPTHPFFTGKASRKDADEATAGNSNNGPSTATATKPPSRRETAITPGKLRSQLRPADDTSDVPSFGMIGMKPRRILGGVDAPWPWKGVTRVGESEEPQTTIELLSNTNSLQSPFQERRKFKGIEYGIPDSEAILSLVTQELQISATWQDDANANSLLRAPERLLTTGPGIQRRVQSEIYALRTSPTSSMEAQFSPDGNPLHPALKNLFDNIPDSLTPFDKGICETLSWTQKYAPRRAADMLGSSVEVAVLRKWMGALKINAGGGATKELSAKSKKNGTTKPPKKKRKKDELHDFIVSDDDGLDELTDPDDMSRPGSSNGGLKSMIRFGGDVNSLADGKKLHNLVLLSGPHGSGKTAAVFAVAKELDFEVFEINSGSRRSGKDVLERIGDMTENHLVQRRVREQPEQTVVDSDTERLTDAVQKDIESGRQKSMSSFFKPKPLAKKEPEAKVAKQQVQPTLGKPKQSQKQSLILLEEVDVLFEEDKNFWQTVEHLALHSKRPIVMTCTDESLVRMNESSLHAILRMSPAPTDLATDYLLLLAAKEGHILRRRAISDLYESKNRDLRATIMELDFWCQMAVGDRKGGLEWIYQRWPPGKDVDANGQILRVASEGTYQAGMGWIGHDVAVEDDHVGFDRQYELMLELSESWSVDPENYSSLSHDDDRMEVEDEGPHHNLKALQDIEFLSELSSATDVYCRVGLPTRGQPIMDPTQPPLLEKARSNFTDGYTFIQADPLIDFTDFDTHLAVSSHLCARRCALTAPGLPAQLSLRTSTQLDEPSIASTILAHLRSTRQPKSLTRADFFVLDPLAEPATAALTSAAGGSSGAMTASSFDRAFRIVVEDLAPYVRGIAAHDLRLEQGRVQSSLVSEGGKQPKRQRTTRAARSALEGGRREDTRRERWFEKSLNLAAVMRTAGREWAGMQLAGSSPSSGMEERMSASASAAGSMEGLE